MPIKAELKITWCIFHNTTVLLCLRKWNLSYRVFWKYLARFRFAIGCSFDRNSRTRCWTNRRHVYALCNTWHKSPDKWDLPRAPSSPSWCRTRPYRTRTTCSRLAYDWILNLSSITKNNEYIQITSWNKLLTWQKYQHWDNIRWCYPNAGHYSHTAVLM